MKAEIISIGTEILLGEITDTNASYLASQLPPLGIDLYWVSQVGDNQPRLVEALKRAWQRSELILTTGGLGPTGDDLTREAISEMLGEKMTVDSSLEEVLRARLGRSSTAMPSSNLKQATIIPSARAIPNANGTAPGWFVEKDGRVLIAMPGPPAEMQPMWQEKVIPQLSHGSGTIILSRTIKTSGLSEAAVGELVSDMFSLANPTFGVYAKPDGIHLRLAAKAESRQQAERLLAEGEASIRTVLGEYVWGTDNDTTGVVIGHLLVEKGLTLAVMEDFSGGTLTASIADIPASPSFFKGGLFACSDEAKVTFGVDARLISQYGGVSPEVARAMAEAARKLLRADIGLSITAGLETKERPMGITYVGIADSKGSSAIARPRRKQHIVATALIELRKWLIAPGSGR
ncbi:MAG: CinA family nicotinamide mononucleotide deamidase-related protein [Chloroflexota bacterium]